MLRKGIFVLLGGLLCACASALQEPVVITVTPFAESPTPHVIVVAATEELEVTVTTKITPRPTPTPRPLWQPISILDIENAFKEEGYSRHPVIDDDGESFFVWIKDNHYEQTATWEDGTFELEVLHDKSSAVRAEHMERKIGVLDTVLPSGFMALLRAGYDDYNFSVGAKVSGDPAETIAYGGKWQRVKAEYNVSEIVIGGYRVRFSLWWWQATCPPEAWYCYYRYFPGLEFTGDSSLTFQTIRLSPVEGDEITNITGQFVNTTQVPTPANVGIGWEFNGPGDVEGWVDEWDLSPLRVNQGFLETNSIGYDCDMRSPILELDAKEYPIFQIRMSLSSVDLPFEEKADLCGEIYFITTSDTNWEEDKVQRFSVSGFGGTRTYTVIMSEVPKWQGIIKQIRVGPMCWGTGHIEIDYIRLLKEEAIAPTQTPDHLGKYGSSKTPTPTNT